MDTDSTLDLRAKLAPFTKLFNGSVDFDKFCDIATKYIIYPDGFITLDDTDITNTLTDVTEADAFVTICSHDDIYPALTQAFNELMEKHPGQKVTKFLIEIQFDRDSKFSMEKMAEFQKFLENFDLDVDRIWGTGYDNTLGMNLRITGVVGLV